MLFVWECLWVFMSYPPQTHFPTTFLKLTMIASSPPIYPPVCECTPSVPTKLTYLYYNHIPSGLLFVPNLESEMSNLHNMFIPCAIVNWSYVFISLIIVRFHLIIEDALNWCHLLVGRWYSLFVLPLCPWGWLLFLVLSLKGFIKFTQISIVWWRRMKIKN